jgi:hypothetical protein
MRMASKYIGDLYFTELHGKNVNYTSEFDDLLQQAMDASLI